MDLISAKPLIEDAWEKRMSFSPAAAPAPVRQALDVTLAALDQGGLRVAVKENGNWHLNEWVKKAVVLFFRLTPSRIIEGAAIPSYDKVSLKFSQWTQDQFMDSQIRIVPGSFVRYGAYISRNTILMPSYVNIGAYVGEETMIDTWATIGTCAQIGARCHISGGTGIGGVLEPLQATPVIIEDDCFIGARSEIVEGVVVETGAVIGMGVFIGASTPIINRQTGEVTYGRVPAYSVVLSGTRPSTPLANGQQGPSLPCAVIVKQVDEKTRQKTAINELLRA